MSLHSSAMVPSVTSRGSKDVITLGSSELKAFFSSLEIAFSGRVFLEPLVISNCESSWRLLLSIFSRSMSIVLFSDFWSEKKWIFVQITSNCWVFISLPSSIIFFAFSVGTLMNSPVVQSQSFFGHSPCFSLFTTALQSDQITLCSCRRKK